MKTSSKHDKSSKHEKPSKHGLTAGEAPEKKIPRVRRIPLPPLNLLTWQNVLRDALFIVSGSILFAIGVVCFEAPNGIAAGGITGLATVTSALADRAGFYLPIGMQTIVANILLLSVVFKRGGTSYLVKTIAGIICSGGFADLFAKFLPVAVPGDLVLAALWGGIITGLGLGLVFRSGGNTGGSDIIAQWMSSKFRMPTGTAILIVDFAVIVVSASVFSIANALYATLALWVSTKIIDMVLDGLHSQRAAYIISEKHELIAGYILKILNRGCTRLEATGMHSGQSRPVLMCVLGRAESVRLKEIVAECDPNALIFISEVHEAFGEGFKKIGT